MNQINIKFYWWRLSISEGNFGDELTAPIVELFSNKNNVIWSPLTECSHLGIGSILEFPWIKKTIQINPKITVLGSGLMAPVLIPPTSEPLNFVAVRGWLTQSILKSQGHPVNRNIGDLGILASSLIQENIEKKYAIGIIPHYKNFEKLQKTLTLKDGAILIDVRSQNPIDVLYNIAKCKIIISESLHGLIASDSLSIPNVWLRNGPLHKGDDFKFVDYFSSIGRNPNDFLRLQDLTNKYLIKDNLHLNWRAVDQLKVQVKDWLSRHLAELQNTENQNRTTESLSISQEDTIPINQWIKPQGLFKDMNKKSH